jgi:hypothetical protein
MAAPASGFKLFTGQAKIVLMGWDAVDNGWQNLII